MDLKLEQGVERSSSVQSVERAMAILSTIGTSNVGCKLMEVARATGLSPSTTHRLLTTLENGRFIHFDTKDNRWHIGLALLTIGSAFLTRSSFVAPAQPFLQRLRDETKETVNLGVADDGEVVILAQHASRQIMRAVSRVGGRVPLPVSAMGKAILSTYDTEDVDHVLRLHRMKRNTAQSIIDPMLFRKQLNEIRQRGYALDDEEVSTSVRCIAAVVYDANACALCAISVSGLASRLPASKIAHISRLLTRAASDITRTVGGQHPKTAMMSSC